MDISDSKLKSLIGKSWSAWTLPEFSTDADLKQLRDSFKPKLPDKAVDHCNLLPAAMRHLYGTRPDSEYFSITKCAGCKCFLKTQRLSHHYLLDSQNNMVCRRTDLIVSGNKTLGKGIPPFHAVRESSKNPLIDCSSSPPNITSSAKVVSSYKAETSIPIRTSPSRSRSSSSYKTDSSVSATSSGSNSGSSKSKSSSHHQSKSKSSSSTSSSSSKNKSSSKSSSSSHSSSHSSSWTSSSKGGSVRSSHKTNSPASYTLSIPSDDTGQNESVESILFSNPNSGSKHTMHIIATSSDVGKSKSGETEYEQLKFYSDSALKRSKVADVGPSELVPKTANSSVLTFSDGSPFKIPLKSKSISSSSGSQHSSEATKKLKTSSVPTKSSSEQSSHKIAYRSSGSPKSIAFTALPTPLELKPKVESGNSSNHHGSDSHEKSTGHSKKKKKKKERDEPRKVIPLKDRAFHPDQHCGVSLPEESDPCTRSLTCKTHSIALRRAVAGRSLRFDTLLAAHKKARDEEKNAKTKENGEESKPKTKKLNTNVASPLANVTLTSPPANIAVMKINVAVDQVLERQRNLSKISTSVAPSGQHVESEGIKVRSVSNTTAAKEAKSPIKPGTPIQRVASKAPLSNKTKPLAKPVVVIEEKAETPGLSLFDIPKDPENNFMYVSSIRPPRNVYTYKGSRKMARNISALSEWNPLDRWITREKQQPRKGFKDPLIELSNPKLVAKQNTTASESSIVSTKPAGINSRRVRFIKKMVRVKRKQEDASVKYETVTKQMKLVSSSKFFQESLVSQSTKGETVESAPPTVSTNSSPTGHRTSRITDVTDWTSQREHHPIFTFENKEFKKI